MEAAEFGTIMAKVTTAIKNVFNATLVYVYIYGGHIPHLHVHLAPHTGEDVFFSDVVANSKDLSLETIEPTEIQVISNDIKRLLPKSEHDRESP